MKTNRKTQRSQSYAKVLLDNSLPAYIRDISVDGFRVYSPVPLPYQEGNSVSCRIFPMNDSDDSFQIKGLIRWNQQDAEGEDLMGILISSFETTEGKILYKSLNQRFFKAP
jgi:hypothetical protein